MQPFSFSTKYVKPLIFFWMFSSSALYSYAASDSNVEALPSRSSTIDKRLMLAIEENNLKKVIALIYEGQNINGQDFFGYSPLHRAAKMGNQAAVECLIKAKALLNPASVRNGNTPLLLAIGAGHKNIVSLLLAAGADPEITNHKGYNGLHLAIQQKRKDMIQLLLQAGASCSGAYTPLLRAIKVHSLPIVQLLLQQKEVTETQDKQGYTELHWAAKQNIVAIFRALLKSGRFNINAKAENGVTPLHLIAANRKSKLLKSLLDCPLLEVNAQDVTGSTPLHYAVATKQLKVVHSLLHYPAIDANVQNNAGQTALHYAIQNQHIAIIKKLLTWTGRGIFIKNKKGVTPLELAMHQKNPKIYKILLAYTSLLGVD